MKNLVIVESPSKSKTIEKYLGKDYKVLSSKGHIRDLATKGKYGLGIDLDNNFLPTYEIIKGKKKMVTDLKKEVNKADIVYLATDPDREGEAISWHLKDVLEPTNYKRVVFNEITKDTVINAFNKARDIDDDLVKSQETRRILDRIIGFRLSKLMQSKTNGKSAGRVQSVAVKLIVDREREIKAFIPEEYWTITANFTDFSAELEKYNNKKIELHNEIEAQEVLNNLSNTFKIESIDKTDKKQQSKPPYITSTLQQDASNKLNFSAKKTMSIAQKLYEGVDLSNETVGLITYMRTDSIRLSDEFIKNTFKYIEVNFGKEYLGRVKKSNKTENVQDAHEAIRPTSITRTPEQVKMFLSVDEFKLYSLIYNRALASLMADVKKEQTSIVLDNNNYKFKATGSVIKFDGYLKVYSDFDDTTDNILPALNKDKINVITTDKKIKEQHFTKPKPRYTEAKLIKEMEELGIGRPSTYAKIMENIIDRGYVKLEDKKFVPTEVGFETTDKLQEFFSNLISVKYTAKMENDLDKIAEGNLIWYNLLNEFYSEFEPMLNNAFNNMEKKQSKETGELCPNCNSSLVIRTSKYGKFVACSNYPKCKYIKQENKNIAMFGKCPDCDGTIVEKRTKRGKVFYGCSNYPKCTYASWKKPENLTKN